MCELLVGLGDVRVLAVTDGPAGLESVEKLLTGQPP
jgi:hypothetical protein